MTPDREVLKARMMAEAEEAIERLVPAENLIRLPEMLFAAADMASGSLSWQRVHSWSPLPLRHRRRGAAVFSVGIAPRLFPGQCQRKMQHGPQCTNASLGSAPEPVGHSTAA